MNFLVDAQLPRRVAAWLNAAGSDAIHTLDLPDPNRTTDDQVNDLADREGRAVVTKDADFVDSHVLRGRPARLLLISTGNISNQGHGGAIGATDPGHRPGVHDALVPRSRAGRDHDPRLARRRLGTIHRRRPRSRREPSPKLVICP